MSYELAIDDAAVDDLEALLDEFAPYNRNEVIDHIDATLVQFALSPLALRAPHRYIPLHFKIEERAYYWAASYYYAENERQLVVARIHKAAL